jgi:hypothetical protein
MMLNRLVGTSNFTFEFDRAPGFALRPGAQGICGKPQRRRSRCRRAPFNAAPHTASPSSIATRGWNAKDLQRIMGFGSYQTAWTWLHKLRAALVRPERDPLSPLRADGRGAGRGKSGPHKELVLVAAEADSHVRLAHAETNDKATLKRFADGQVVADVRVVTDGLASYDSDSLGNRPYERVVQTKAERRESDAVQVCHWTISLLKRCLLGTTRGAAAGSGQPSQPELTG